MKVFKALFKLINNLHKNNKKVNITENYSEPNYSEPKIQEPEIIKQYPKEESAFDTKIENPHINQIREWAMKKIDYLHEADRHRNAKALASEFDEWINIPDGTEELDYLCLEEQDENDEEFDIR